MISSVPNRAGALCALACAIGVSALASPVMAADSALAQAIARLNADTRQERAIQLSDLGIDEPILLSGGDARRELFLPVPANVPLLDAALDFDASYLNGEKGRNTLLLSLDGYPVRADGLTADEGDASVKLGVDKSSRDSGSVRLGIAWSSVVDRKLCQDERMIGNVLRVQPDTRLRYAFDARDLHDLGAAWNALPGKPGLLVAPGTLAKESYDAAWRLGVELERTGRQARVLPLPQVGDSVDLGELKIPAELEKIPAFARLAGKQKYTLANPADVGALLMLGQTDNVRFDLAVADPALAQAVNRALDALHAEVQGVDAQAGEALQAWRAQHANLALNPAKPGDVRMGLLGTRPVLMIEPGRVTQAIGLFGEAWNKVARGRALTVTEARTPEVTDNAHVALDRLGGKPGSLDVLARTDWSATFPIGSVAYDGRTPVNAVVDVAAAPGASNTAPVAALFFNDYLIGARQLTANGQRERIEARIPAYALAARNTLRVQFQRQPVSNVCRETPQPYPVSVLPSTHIALDNQPLAADFPGIAARFAQDTQLWLGQPALDHPADSLPRLIRVASATGVSPLRAHLNVSDDVKNAIAPSGAFLAFDVPVKDSDGSVKVDNGKLLIDGKPQPLVDLQSLDRMAALQVVQAGGQTGVSYHTLGATPPTFDRPLVLQRGDVSLLADSGALVTYQGHDAGGGEWLDKNDNDPTGLEAWRKPSLLWLIPGGFLLLLLLILAGRIARNRRS